MTKLWCRARAEVVESEESTPLPPQSLRLDVGACWRATGFARDRENLIGAEQLVTQPPGEPNLAAVAGYHWSSDPSIPGPYPEAH